MKNNRAFTFVEVAIVVVIIGLLVAMAMPGYHAIRANNSAESYRVWCKLHKRDDITFEEWKAAKRAGILPQIRP